MINIIWDLDGTLIDSTKEIIQCLELAIKYSDVDISEQIRPFVIGPTIDIILKDSFPKHIMTDFILKEIITHFRNIYDNSSFDLTEPYPGIEEIIQNMTAFIHHIVTNKPDVPTKNILNKLNWIECISSITTPYTNSNATAQKKKTKSEIFQNVIAKYNNGFAFIGIGDMKQDCLAAKENNITSIGVLWGSGDREELINCSDNIFENATQLKKYLYSVS